MNNLFMRVINGLLIALFLSYQPLIGGIFVKSDAELIHCTGSMKCISIEVTLFTIELRNQIASLPDVYHVKFKGIKGTNNELVKIYADESFDEDALSDLLSGANKNFTLLTVEYFENIDMGGEMP